MRKEARGERGGDAQYKVALVTGAARRIGKAIALGLHEAEMDLVLHYRESRAEAEKLARECRRRRQGSAIALKADLAHAGEVPALIEQALGFRGRLDVLVHNASVFRPTPVGGVTTRDWEELAGVHVLAPLLLAQQAAPALRRTRGCIVHLLDVYAQRPLPGYALYCATKAALETLTRALAVELAPEIRVNAVAPGAILWPEDMGERERQAILQRIPLGRTGTSEEIAEAVRYLACKARYVTGEVVRIDGGRSLTW